MKNRTDLCLFVIGIVMVATGAIMWQGNQARAATQNYNETYTVAKWHNLNLNSAGGSTPDRILSLGPAEWSVTGSVGTTSYSETWKVKSWKDSCHNYTGAGFTCSPSVTFSDSNTYGSQKGYLLEHQDWGAAIHSGMYSALTNESSSRFVYASIFSLPASWEVTGTITSQ